LTSSTGGTSCVLYLWYKVFENNIEIYGKQIKVFTNQKLEINDEDSFEINDEDSFKMQHLQLMACLDVR